MIMMIYSIYDRVQLESMPLFEAKNHAAALRKFSNWINREKKQNDDFPVEDFSLWCLGEIDHEMNVLKAWEPVDMAHDLTLADVSEDVG